MLVDSPQARSIVGRLHRAECTLQEMIDRSAPAVTISLARMNVTVLQAKFDLLPRRQAA